MSGMRLAFLYRRLAREGGTEADFYRTVAALADRGHDVHVFCADIRAETPAGVTTHRVPVVRAGRLTRLLSFAWSAPRVADRFRPWDVVVGFGRTARQDLVRCGGGTHLAYLQTMRASGARRRGLGPYHRMILALEAQQYRPGSFRRVLAVSERVRDEIVAGYSVGRGLVRVTYNGIDLDRFHPVHRGQRRLEVRRRLGISSENRVVLSVGSGFARKGVDSLLRLWAERAPAGAVLVVVGGDERLGGYRRTVRKLQLDRQVMLPGPQSAVEEFYAAADAVVVASLQEAFGNVVMEALAAGLPVVTSTRVGAAELLTGRLRQLVVDDPRDTAAIRERLAFALGDDWTHLAQEGRRIAESRPWSEHFDQVERLLEETATAGAPVESARR